MPLTNRALFRTFFLMMVVLGSFPAQADEKLKDIACRSVHLAYNAPVGDRFENEITIKASARGTYFMVCGWDKGYFGLQELGNGKKLLLFSVWDSEQDDPKAVEEDKRTKLVYKDPQVRIGGFGGEGTGGQSFFDTTTGRSISPKSCVSRRRWSAIALSTPGTSSCPKRRHGST